MDCDEIRERLLRGEAPGEGGEQHIAQCPACQALVADAGATGRALSGREDTMPEGWAGVDPVQLVLSGERGPRAWLRSRSTPVRTSMVLLVLSAVALFVAVEKERDDLAVYPPARMVLALGAFLVAFAAAARLSLFPLHLSSPSRALVRSVFAAALVLPFALALLPAAHLDHPASLGGAASDVASRAIRCFLYGAVSGLPALIALRLVDRRDFGSVLPAVFGASAMALAGNFVLQLHCALTHPVHLVLGHALLGPVLVAVVALGARLRQRAR